MPRTNPTRGKRGRPSTASKGRIISESEELVLSYLRQGLTYAAIAERLNRCVETIRKHARNIYKKLQVKNRIQACNKFYGLA